MLRVLGKRRRVLLAPALRDEGRAVEVVVDAGEGARSLKRPGLQRAEARLP